MANIPISSFTAAANATGIGMSGFSLTGANAQSMLDLAGTWNTSGTPTGLKLNVTDTASNAASLLMDLQTGGVSRFRVAKDGGFVQSGSGVNWHYITTASNELSIQGNAVNNGVAITNNGIRACSANPTFSFSTTVLSAADLILTRDAANTLAQRNGTNAQTFRVYNTFTDASNYERGFVRWSTNVLQIGTEKLGTGTARALEFQTDGTTRLTIGTTGLATFASGIDLGVVGILRTRYINNGDNALTMWDFTGGSGGTAVFALGGTTPFMRFGGITSSFPAIQRNGNELRFRLADDTGFCPVRVSQIGFNGATSSFPMLSNNGTTLQTKLADDSAFAPHAMQYLDVTDGVTAPGAAAGRARIYVDTADGDLKVVFADGTVKTIVTDT